jgi:hypothetical protein
MWIKKLSTKNPHGLNKHDWSASVEFISCQKED